ncbi:ectoine/hydroxyectoine ABC transporter substrate-binding protein EhuB [Salinicola rhizosphaerae]|uniref:Amino-acid ABC transporter periplasmic-binding protein y4tE n=1 Tax=Salinicola rhizosphaerae TaxID=1443141 RepID=A0ABQ3DY15_9GAMM|nr:ectoine/hydroxyectoine ABC transporter substrate-binding protein EhuB [Salinicola rhizosphaerae]GHB12480.1 putative amino-acid ABC transporter periplasmic-binding protein y4tE [Salinicola rhizosphaerae]
MRHNTNKGFINKALVNKALVGKGVSLMIAGSVLSCLTISAAQAASLQEIKDSGSVRIAVANEIPYGYMDMSGEAKGAGPDVIRHIMNEMGVDDIEWVTTNFSSLIPGLQADRFDIAAAEMAVLPDRCNQVIFSEPNSSYGEGLLVADGNPKDLHAFSDFVDGDAKVAIMAGADQLDMLQSLGVPQENMVTISSNADAISTVSTGRADAYAATSLTVSELAGKSDDVESAAQFKDPVIDGEEVRSWGAFAFNSDNTELRDAVNEALEEYKQSDDWSQTLMDYGFSQADVDGSTMHTTEELCTADS